MVFAAVALGGWTMLRDGTWPRRIWAVGALLLVLFGIGFTATRVSVARLDSELSFRGDAHDALQDVIAEPAVKRGAACGPADDAEPQARPGRALDS